MIITIAKLIFIISCSHTIESYRFASRLVMSGGNTDSQANSFNKSYKKFLKKTSKLLLTTTTLSSVYLTSSILSNQQVDAKSSEYPIYGSDEIMKKKEHGTSDKQVQQKLRWGCDVALADKICNFNRNWAEFAGIYFPLK